MQLTQNQLEESDSSPDTLLSAFGTEVFFVIALLVWNHNTVSENGWQELATGLGDMFIFGGALLYAFLWTIAALIRLVMYRRESEPNMRTTRRYGYGIALHCMAMLMVPITASILFR